jgi:PAS domain S-box-containing protein
MVPSFARYFLYVKEADQPMTVLPSEDKPTTASTSEILQRQRALLEISQQFVSLLAPDGRVLEVNTPALEARSLRRQEVLGQSFWDIEWWQAPEARDQLREAVRRASQGEVVQFSTEIAGGDQAPATLNFSLRPVMNASGEVIYLLSEIRDVTDMAQTIEKLRQSQRMLVQATQIAGLGYWTWDIKGDRVQISNEVKRIFDANSKAEVNSYQGLMRYVHPEDRALVRRSIQAAFERDSSFSLLFRITREDGEVRMLRSLGRIERDDSGAPRQLTGTVQDISEIKSLETRLLESEKRYRYLVQELPNLSVILYDPELTVFLVEGREHLDRTLAGKNLEGMSLPDLLTIVLGETPGEEDLSSFKSVWNGDTHSFERISGERCYTVSLIPLRNDEGEIYAGMAVFQDITQRIRVAEKLTLQADQLKLLNRMGQIVVSNLDTGYIFQEVVTTVRKMIGAHGVFIFLEKDGRLIIEAQDEENQVDLRGQGMPATQGIAGEVWQSQKSILRSGEECQSHLFRPLAQSLGYAPLSFLSVPITWREQPFGVFQAVHPEEGQFAQEDLQLLESAAAWTAIALGNALQHQRLERRLAEADVTADLLSEVLSASLDLKSVLQHVVDAANTIIPAVDWAAIHLLNEHDNQLYLQATSGIAVGPDEYKVRRGEGIAGRVLETGQLINVSDVSLDTRVVSIPRTTGARALLVAPIIDREGDVIGTITLEAATPGRFAEEDEDLLVVLARQAGLAIENARLYESAEHGRQVAQMQRERLRQLTRRTVTAQEEERERIARELHDEAGQSLTALKISLELIRDGLPADMQDSSVEMQEAINLVGQTLENLRSISHNLRPPALDRLGLSLALAGLCQQFEALTHIPTHYQALDLPRLYSSNEITLYRFVQEALTNAAKHAQATEIRVWLQRQDDWLEIHVQDSGKGMESNPLELDHGDQQGIGLAGMEERLSIIDGRLEVQSTPGVGTHLCAFVPIRLREESA